MTPARRSGILIFVEDPGAANFVADLPRALSERGHAVHLATAGTATDYLASRGVPGEPLLASCDLDAMLADIAPCLVAVGSAENPDSVGLKLASLATARKIPTVGVIDASTHLGHRFRGRSGNPTQYLPDTLLVPDAASRDGLIELGVATTRIVVAGHPHWDYVRGMAAQLRSEDRSTSQRRLFGKVLDRRILVFGAELSDGMDPQQFRRTSEYSIIGTGSSNGRTEIVIEEFLRATALFRDEVFLVLRLHPKSQAVDFSAYLSAFDTVSKLEPSLAILHIADAVIGMTSMLMIEAVLLNRPTLAILPRPQEAGWLPTIVAGITPYASDSTAIAERLRRLVSDLPAPDAAAIDRLFPPGALQRVADVFDGLMLRYGARTPGAQPPQ
jgi:hypothetical protein